ncbi:MAG: hypothetical protein M0Q88_00865 [Bacilli bacterium]|nr:hypothetical protein [Bacilli bacterium]
MKKSSYKLKDFDIDYSKVVKLIWNDIVLYDDTLSYYDPTLASVETLKEIKVQYMDKNIYNINMNIKNGRDIVLTILGENVLTALSKSRINMKHSIDSIGGEN